MPPLSPRTLLGALLALFVSMLSIQFGASFATRLFPAIGAAGTVALRQGIAAPILLLVLRPWRARPEPGAWPWLVGYGLSLGAMNLLFYLAIRTVPLGLAVAIEFVGPLAVALGGSRRLSDLLWAALAAVGLLLVLPLGATATRIDPAGALLALGAGAFWGLYILLGRRAGAAAGMAAAAIGTAVAAAMLVPIGLWAAGPALLRPPVLFAGLGVAVLTSALPYSCEMFALPRLPARTFGTLMSLEPAVAALAALLVLGERLSALQWLAVCAIMAAAGGASLSAARPEAMLPD